MVGRYFKLGKGTCYIAKEGINSLNDKMLFVMLEESSYDDWIHAEYVKDLKPQTSRFQILKFEIKRFLFRLF